ncbi:hypothetical protein NQU36_27060, partial [Escherichia coli]|uniref:hypothetical protein n=1 Tax=Escherichia coli TaxID=562 RepID=UPI002117346F
RVGRLCSEYRDCVVLLHESGVFIEEYRKFRIVGSVNICCVDFLFAGLWCFFFCASRAVGGLEIEHYLYYQLYFK